MGCGCNKKKQTTANAGQTHELAQQQKFVDKQSGFLKSKAYANQQRLAAEKKEEEIKSHSLFQKALNLGEAVANHIVDGMEKVSKQQMATRLSICKGCPALDEAKGTCTKCGCNLSIKAGWRSSTCPLDKWPVIEK